MRAGPGLKFTFALSLNESFSGLTRSINTITGGGSGTITLKSSLFKHSRERPCRGGREVVCRMLSADRAAHRPCDLGQMTQLL